jgi:signal transduction histidine kinase
MKLFNKATLKLTAIYTAVLMVISVGFSIAVGAAAAHEMNRPFERSRIIIQSSPKDILEQEFRARAAQANGRIAAVLVLVNFGVLIIGAGGSYFLARWTLRPIEKAFARETRFVSDASHELRTPLAAIQMENEVMLRDENTGKIELRAQIASNLEEIDKLRALTDYLLRLNQDEVLKLSDVNITTIVHKTIKNAKKVAATKEISIVAETPLQAPSLQSMNTTARTELAVKAADSDITWRTNAEALTEILAILLDNAIKYSPPKSTITVAAADSQITISDQGPGIAPDDLPHIFERFYRAEKSRTTDGYGLGLSLAKHLADEMNLNIEARNNPSDGANFTISR